MFLSQLLKVSVKEITLKKNIPMKAWNKDAKDLLMKRNF
jgi:hypothetical protein